MLSVTCYFQNEELTPSSIALATVALIYGTIFLSGYSSANFVDDFNRKIHSQFSSQFSSLHKPDIRSDHVLNLTNVRKLVA